MESSTYPFPLAVNSCHHSHYHRFLLGADPSILSPFPKPYCVGALSGFLGRLTSNLNLPEVEETLTTARSLGPTDSAQSTMTSEMWRPTAGSRWPTRGLPENSALSISCGLPTRRSRRSPSSPATGGSSTVLCPSAMTSARAWKRQPARAIRVPRVRGFPVGCLPGNSSSPTTGGSCHSSMSHSSAFSNFTSFAVAPCRLACIDSAALARAAERQRIRWLENQAEALTELGYRVAPRREAAHELRVEGVSESLVAAIEAPRIAVIRILERIVVGERPPSAGGMGAELPPEVIAAMAEQIESALARSLWHQKPSKIALPPEGPWRVAVREHLECCCPGQLVGLDAAAARARAVVSDSSIFPTPQLGSRALPRAENRRH